MRYALALLLIPLLPAVAAADYLMAVSEDAPASDVVAAANLAARMQAEADVSFSGVIDRDLYEQYDIDDLNDEHIVLLDRDDDYARYIVGSGNHRNAIVDVLEDEGYDVDTVVAAELEQEDLLVRAERSADREESAQEVDSVQEEPPVIDEQQDEQERPAQETQDEQPEAVAPIVPPVAEETQNEPGSLPLPEAEPEKPGPVSRFFGWLRSVFS